MRGKGLTPGQSSWLRQRGIGADALGRFVADGGAGTATLPVPTKPEELAELLGDVTRVQAHIKAGTFKDVIASYSRYVAKSDMDMRRQVDEQVKATLVEFLKENGGEGGTIGRLDITPQTVASGATRADRNLHNPRAMGATLDPEYRVDGGFGKFFQNIWHGAPHTADRQAAITRLRNAFSESVPSEGGFLVPETLRSEILRLTLENAIVRPRARVIPMETLRVPFPAVDSTSNASSVYGGIVAYWTEEGGALTASSASFSRVVLEAKKLTAYSEVPNELIADSIGSFEAFMGQIFPEAVGFYEDDGFMNGSGVGEPLGFMNADAMISVTKETGQAADTIVWENIVKMYSRMLPGSLGRAAWICSIDTFPQLATMALAVGTGGSAIWLNNGQVGPPMTILGRPVIFTEKAPKLGDLGDINFVDLGFYLIGDRQVMSASSSPHFKFSTDVTAFRIINRVDGRPWLQSAITPKNSGPTLSPFVQLEAR
jgi:HK97 family phage major capsid protein